MDGQRLLDAFSWGEAGLTVDRRPVATMGSDAGMVKGCIICCRFINKVDNVGGS